MHPLQHHIILYLLLILIWTGCTDAPSTNTSSFSFEATNDTIDQDSGRDSAIKAMIAPYKKELDSAMNVVVGFAERTLEEGKPEGPLGNFVADLTLERTGRWLEENGKAEADFCLLNNGGLRVPIPEGPVTKRKVYELMPFENIVEVLTLSGPTTKELFKYLAERDGEPVSGVRMTYDEEGPDKILVKGEPLDTTRKYRVVTTDYLANGGDDMVFFTRADKRVSTGIKLRDMILNHLKEKEKVNGAVDGRITQEAPK